MDNDDLMKHCMNIQILLEVGDTKDINGIELFDELIILCDIIEEDTLPLNVLEKILNYSADDLYCNVFIVLRILLTMPVTTASAECFFSKLKLIKNYLRSTLCKEKVTNLSIISIKKEISNQLKYDNINIFADMKSRKLIDPLNLWLDYRHILANVLFKEKLVNPDAKFNDLIYEYNKTSILIEDKLIALIGNYLKHNQIQSPPKSPIDTANLKSFIYYYEKEQNDSISIIKNQLTFIQKYIYNTILENINSQNSSLYSLVPQVAQKKYNFSAKFN
ncbi:HAT, C-terminal dimerisation domain [Cinara cedri]|uniref:HAT, C-terminal dimerisation domain n=1 Tax=Cinara cedri TaxID=506608 RepID=A0A5E4NQT2_9HEMI|nr:HAT, C-terminal dimerisation domain [Cinara cedri]